MSQPTTPNTVEDFLPLPKAHAWEHVMDNTEGIKGNRPHVSLSFSKNSPFGMPGRDYSKTFPVTKQPLFTADQVRAAILADRAQRTPAAPVVAEGLATTALRKLCDQLDGEKRRMRHTPGTGQDHSYMLCEDVDAYVEEARKALAHPSRCEECVGTGKVGPDENPLEMDCEVCNGSGQVAAHPVAGSPAEAWSKQLENPQHNPVAAKLLDRGRQALAAPMPASEAASQQTDQAHVMPPFAAPASQHLEGTTALFEDWWHEGAHPYRDLGGKKQPLLNQDSAWQVWMAATVAKDGSWMELTRRLYVELFHCHQQMMSETDDNGDPLWLPGVTVPSVLADAKAAFELAARFRAEGGITNDSNANLAAPAAPTDAKAVARVVWCRHNHHNDAVWLTDDDLPDGTLLYTAAQSVRDAAQPIAPGKEGA